MNGIVQRPCRCCHAPMLIREARPLQPGQLKPGDHPGDAFYAMQGGSYPWCATCWVNTGVGLAHAKAVLSADHQAWMARPDLNRRSQDQNLMP